MFCICLSIHLNLSGCYVPHVLHAAHSWVTSNVSVDTIVKPVTQMLGAALLCAKEYPRETVLMVSAGVALVALGAFFVNGRAKSQSLVPHIDRGVAAFDIAQPVPLAPQPKIAKNATSLLEMESSDGGLCNHGDFCVEQEASDVAVNELPTQVLQHRWIEQIARQRRELQIEGLNLESLDLSNPDSALLFWFWADARLTFIFFCLGMYVDPSVGCIDGYRREIETISTMIGQLRQFHKLRIADIIRQAGRQYDSDMEPWIAAVAPGADDVPRDIGVLAAKVRGAQAICEGISIKARLLSGTRVATAFN